MGVKNGGESREKNQFCGRYPAVPAPTGKKQGASPGEEINMSKKEKLPLYLSPKKKAILERRYTEDGSRNLTGFIVKSVELDMGLSTLVDCVKLDDEYLRGERRYFDALGYRDRRGDSHHLPCRPALPSRSGSGKDCPDGMDLSPSVKAGAAHPPKCCL